MDIRRIFALPSVTTVLMLAILLGSCGSPKVLPKAESPADVHVDGENREWKKPFSYFKDQVAYAIGNDAERLYICVTTADRTTQMKIMRAGISIGIDTLGRKKKHVLLEYPKSTGETMQQPMMESGTSRDGGDRTSGGDRTNGNDRMNGGNGNNTDRMKKMMLARGGEFHLQGFNPQVGNGLMPLQNSFGITAAIDIDSTGVMVYEVAIPFKTFYAAGLTKNNVGRTWGISITVNGIEAPTMGGGGGPQGGNGGMGGGMSGGMSGGMGGGMRGGGMGGPGGGMGGPGGGSMGSGGSSSTMSQDKTFRTKLQLFVP